jgi:hypothetical protein
MKYREIKRRCNKMNNKKLAIKVLAAGLVVASVAGTTLGFVQKSNANEVQNVVETRGSGMYAKRYLSTYMDRMPYMTSEEFCKVFTEERFVASVEALVEESNTRGGGSLSNKIKDLTPSQISDIANKIKDKLPQSLIEETGLAEDGKIEDVLNELKDTVQEDSSKEDDSDKTSEEGDKPADPTQEPQKDEITLVEAIKVVLEKFGIKEPALTAIAYVIAGILALFGIK